MIDRKYLLSSKQMAQFAADGYLRFDELTPRELNETALEEFKSKVVSPGGGYSGESLLPRWPESLSIGKLLRLPEVQGILQSLVGPEPRYDHHAVHIVKPQTESAQSWHADAIIDLRMHFDVQFFYFPHDTPREMGGTMILPGSHFRRINESDISRYQNFRGQLPIVCKAGTVVFVHHGIWHCAQPNRTANTRYMFKMRLNPSVKQTRLWNTDDLNAGEVRNALATNHPWYGNEARIEQVNHIKFWRFLTGNEEYDHYLWMGRIENTPEN